MPDVVGTHDPDSPADADWRRRLEMFFFAYRDVTLEPDAILAEYGFGRAHHRVIYFVGRRPGMTVSDLLGVLKITKQSLARVLGQLVRDGFIHQRPGPRDRRQRLLDLTPLGIDLDRRLTARQGERFARALAEAGFEATAGFDRVLLALMDEAGRARFKAD